MAWQQGERIGVNDGDKWYWMSWLIAVALLIGYAQRAELVSLYATWQTGEQELQQIQEELTALQIQREKLEERVEGLDKDPLELEAAIRGTQGGVRDGEIVYRVFLPEEVAP